MSEVNQLDKLKEQANQLGIEYPNNTTIKSLKKRITDHLNQETLEETKEQYTNLYQENMKLVKVIITPVDSAKRDYQGEYFSVGNDVLGTVTRFVPFNEEWMIEEILAKHIEAKQYQHITTKRSRDNRNETLDSRLVPAYNVQRLPLPTKEELAELKRIQEARQGVE